MHVGHYIERSTGFQVVVGMPNRIGRDMFFIILVRLQIKNTVNNTIATIHADVKRVGLYFSCSFWSGKSNAFVCPEVKFRFSPRGAKDEIASYRMLAVWLIPLVQKFKKRIQIIRPDNIVTIKNYYPLVWGIAYCVGFIHRHAPIFHLMKHLNLPAGQAIHLLFNSWFCTAVVNDNYFRDPGIVNYWGVGFFEKVEAIEWCNT